MQMPLGESINTVGVNNQIMTITDFTLLNRKVNTSITSTILSFLNSATEREVLTINCKSVTTVDRPSLVTKAQLESKTVLQ